MIVTQAEARKIIAAAYGPEFKIRLTVGCTIGVRPVCQTNINMHTLAWRKLAVDRKGDLPSAVYIGRVMANGSIDWDYTGPSSGRAPVDYSIAAETHEGPDPDMTMNLFQVSDKNIGE